MSLLDHLTREQAARLLCEAERIAALSDLLEAQATELPGETHPRTVERLRRIATLEACLTGLLRNRAQAGSRIELIS